MNKELKEFYDNFDLPMEERNIPLISFGESRFICAPVPLQYELVKRYPPITLEIERGLEEICFNRTNRLEYKYIETNGLATPYFCCSNEEVSYTPNSAFKIVGFSYSNRQQALLDLCNQLKSEIYNEVRKLFEVDNGIL